MNQDQQRDTSIPEFSCNDFMILHQNIKSLSNNKIDELSISLATNPPHVFCLTEHHLRDNELDSVPIKNYKLGAKFCRNSFNNGGVCIFLQDNLQFTDVSLFNFCREKDLEICAVKLYLAACTMCIITVYCSPAGNFQYFLNILEIILNSIYTKSIEIIIYGDFNINYFSDSTFKCQLDSLFASYCLASTVKFPTRIHNNSSRAIDNIFINTIKFDNFSIYPFVNGMSHHDAQIIVIHNLSVLTWNKNYFFSWRFDKNLITDFNMKLSYESLDDIFMDKDVNTIFNNFLNTYLTIFYSSFPLTKVYHKSSTKPWLTLGIKTSCINKRKLFLLARNSDDLSLLNYYRGCCKILSKVIKLVKKHHCNTVLAQSANKSKTTWNIIKNITNMKPHTNQVSLISVNGTLSNNHKVIAKASTIT
jgi:exonuclease III